MQIMLIFMEMLLGWDFFSFFGLRDLTMVMCWEEAEGKRKKMKKGQGGRELERERQRGNHKVRGRRDGDEEDQ